MSPPESRLAVITGATAGLGRALAREMARKGRPVLAVTGRKDRLLSLAVEPALEGFAPIHAQVLDVTVTAAGAPAELLSRAEALGGADWLVNDAGFGERTPVPGAGPDRLSATMLPGRDVVRVPGVVYKLSTARVRLFPRALARRVSGRLHRPSQPRRGSRSIGRAR